MKRKQLCVLLLAAGLAAGAAACGNRTETETPAETAEQEPSGEEAPADMQPEEESETGEGSEVPAEAEEQEPSGEEDTVDNENQKDQYMSALLAVCTENRLPDGSALNPAEDNTFDRMSDNRFAVCDIDGDGSRELIIQYVTAPTAGMRELVYDYDAETKSVREEFQEYPLLTYYDNGIIEAGWSHNQGKAGDALWPYTLWQYDQEEDAWHVVAEVDAWDRRVTETDYSTDLPFPQEVDADGDGVLYYIRPEGGHGSIDPVDGAEYEQWRASFLGGAKKIDVLYEEMTEQNICMLE